MMQTLRQIQQKRRNPLFRPHIAQQQHHALITNNLSAHQAEKMRLNARDFLTQRFPMPERQLAHLTVFQSHRIAAMGMHTNAVHPNQFARHKKTGNLIPTVLGGNRCFKKAGAYRIQRMEGFTRTK